MQRSRVSIRCLAFLSIGSSQTSGRSCRSRSNATKNTGRSSVDLTGVSLFHKAFKQDGSFEWDLVVRLFGEIGTGQVLRVHSGKGPFSVVRAEDKVGSDYYMFTGQSRYMWNNDYGDASLLWQPSDKVTIDEASYDPYPPEGAILQRAGSKLVAPAWVASRW